MRLGVARLSMALLHTNLAWVVSNLLSSLPDGVQSLMAQFHDLAFIEEGCRIGGLMHACRERNVPTLHRNEEQAIFTYSWTLINSTSPSEGWKRKFPSKLNKLGASLSHLMTSS